MAATLRLPNLHVYRLPLSRPVPVTRTRVAPLVGPPVGVMVVTEVVLDEVAHVLVPGTPSIALARVAGPLPMLVTC